MKKVVISAADDRVWLVHERLGHSNISALDWFTCQHKHDELAHLYNAYMLSCHITLFYSNRPETYEQ